jgi:hypothetical protein
MSYVWDTMLKLQDDIQAMLDSTGLPVNEGHDFPWPNHVWTSASYRRAHLDAVDVRDTKGLYMLHVTVYPHTNDTSPIFGFDIICGEKKITGCFHDFSASSDPRHEMMLWFQEHVKQYDWRKERELPEWARMIFSPGMVAAGNVSDEKEIYQILNMVSTTLPWYLGNVGKTLDLKEREYTKGCQNFYSQHQRMNPHTPRVMQSLGFDETTVNRFISDCLFPDLV